MSELQIKTIYIVWTNSDLTEGRGRSIPIAYSESPSTAARLAKGKGVQGSGARVEKFDAILRRGWLCAPVDLTPPSKADLQQDEALTKKLSALEKARSLGMTEDDLKALGLSV